MAQLSVVYDGPRLSVLTSVHEGYTGVLGKSSEPVPFTYGGTAVVGPRIDVRRGVRRCTAGSGLIG